jgi:hypothetical protein
MRLRLLILSVMIFAAGFATALAFQARPRGGYIVQHDSDVARNEPGSHSGGGQTVGYSFFATTPDLRLVFRKRALQPGSASRPARSTATASSNTCA